MSASSQFKMNFVWKRILSTSDSALIAIVEHISVCSPDHDGAYLR